jgi:hypothetical protein
LIKLEGGDIARRDMIKLRVQKAISSQCKSAIGVMFKEARDRFRSSTPSSASGHAAVNREKTLLNGFK